MNEIARMAESNIEAYAAHIDLHAGSIPEGSLHYEARKNLRYMLAVGRKVSLKTWCAKHDGQSVNTVQVGPNGEVWMPGERVIDAYSRSGSVVLDGSSRYYAGVQAISATDSAILAYDKSMNTVVMLTVA